MIRVLLVSTLAVAACCTPSEPKQRCEDVKRAAYAQWIGGEMPRVFLASDVWRIDPVTTLYFSEHCDIRVDSPEVHQ